MNYLNKIESEIAELREQLRRHELYNNLGSIDDVRVFMENHVYHLDNFLSNKTIICLFCILARKNINYHPHHDNNFPQCYSE